MTHHVTLDGLVLQRGGHPEGSGEYCVNEAIAWYAGEPHSASPKCVSPVLRAFTMRLNDRLGDEDRQRLKAFIPRLVGTAGDPAAGEKCAWIAADWAVRTAAPHWLRLAGMEEQAATLESYSELTAESCPPILPALRALRDDLWQRNEGWRERIRAAVRKALAEKPAADAVAAAAADAVAAADAAADAAAVADRKRYWKVYDAVYKAVREKIRALVDEKLAPASRSMTDEAFDLLDRLIAV